MEIMIGWSIYFRPRNQSDFPFTMFYSKLFFPLLKMFKGIKKAQWILISVVDPQNMSHCKKKMNKKIFICSVNKKERTAPVRNLLQPTSIKVSLFESREFFFLCHQTRVRKIISISGENNWLQAYCVDYPSIFAFIERTFDSIVSTLEWNWNSIFATNGNNDETSDQRDSSRLFETNFTHTCIVTSKRKGKCCMWRKSKEFNWQS